MTESAALDVTALKARHRDLAGRNTQIDMTRGKPAPEQLDLSNGILTVVGPDDCFGGDGTDYRNYGLGTGTPEAKAFFAEYMEVTPKEIIVGGNSSLQLMYDTLAGAVLYGMPGGDGPWGKVEGGAKVLCPVPGYDRHYTVCETLGIGMITVDLADDGPDMDRVEDLVANDPAIKAIWCVPKYSNPTGIVYADAVVDRLAAMKAAAGDFRILWDNAYNVHHLGGGIATVKNILAACRAAGNADRPIMFGSTSKITHAGSGIAVIAASEANIADLTAKMAVATIGPDKINQTRHVKFFGDVAGLRTHMDQHAAIIGPKFERVLAALDKSLGGTGLATWSTPQGGYFVSVDVPDGCAARVVALAAEAGVKLTPAGATFPYGKDPRDRNLRLAPTMPSLDEIDQAMDVVCTCIKLAAAERS
jgi:DNA-binding transcriptional MocR family regulator